jgi:biopolymer transport protein ExbD
LNMRRFHRYRRHRDVPELNVTTFLNLMVVLIPFLLVTAVFSRITIMELNLPTAASGPVAEPPLVTIEVIVRKTGLEIADGRNVVASIPKNGERHDLAKLSEYLLRLKADYSRKEDATVLVEPDVAYEDLIHVMDAVREAEIEQDEQGDVIKVALFPEISIGDAP